MINKFNNDIKNDYVVTSDSREDFSKEEDHSGFTRDIS